MPTLQLKISPPQDPGRCQVLASALSALSTRLLGKRQEVTAVMVEALPAARWFVDGRPVQGPTALLEISITQGSNTAGEKSAFIEAAFHELQRQLGEVTGGLEPASYVMVRELPATDWGYGGITQLARRGMREPATPSLAPAV